MLGDALAIDECHFLLGRPCSYDNHVIHDGLANTYAFKHNGLSHTLSPLSLPNPLKSKPGKGNEEILNVSETRVYKAISNSKPLFS